MTIIEDFNEFDFHENQKVYYRFDSYSKFVEEANWMDKTDLDRSSLDVMNSDFFGTLSLPQALKLAQVGWKEGITNLEEYKLNNLTNKAKKNFSLAAPIYHVYGQYVDIGKYLLGDPNCMIFNQIQTTPKHLSIIFEFGFNAGYGQDDYSKLGNRILSLTDSLERNNIRIELIARTCIKASNRYDDEAPIHVTDIKLKAFGEFLDFNKLAFACCHRAFHRRLWFSVVEKQSNEIRSAFGFHDHSGYGRTEDLIYTKKEEKESLILPIKTILDDSDFAKITDQLNERFENA